MQAHTPLGNMTRDRVGAEYLVTRDAVEMGTRRDLFTVCDIPAILIGRHEVALCGTGSIFCISGVYTVLNWAFGGGPKPASRARCFRRTSYSIATIASSQRRSASSPSGLAR